MSRCVHCSRPGEAHGENGACGLTTGSTFASMELPTGKTCADCVWLKRCESLGVAQVRVYAQTDALIRELRQSLGPK